jgi:hypothetical protein
MTTPTSTDSKSQKPGTVALTYLSNIRTKGWAGSDEAFADLRALMAQRDAAVARCEQAEAHAERLAAIVAAVVEARRRWWSDGADTLNSIEYADAIDAALASRNIDATLAALAAYRGTK